MVELVTDSDVVSVCDRLTDCDCEKLLATPSETVSFVVWLCDTPWLWFWETEWDIFSEPPKD